MGIELHIFDNDNEYVGKPIELTNILPIGTKIFDFGDKDYEVWQVSYSIDEDITICYAAEWDWAKNTSDK